jgi:DNA-binding transcriptional regulator YhcF (GntR family)
MAMEDEQRLKDMLRAIEAQETVEDLPPDPEEYDDMGGIKSLDRGAPSIKMASEPEDEFELELGTVIKEYNDLKEQGIIRDISIEEYIDKYLSKKRKSPNKMMASMEENEKEFMRLVEEFMEQGFNQQQAIEAARDTLERKAVAMGGPMRMGYAGGTPKQEEIVKPPKSMMMDTTTYPLGQDHKMIN